MVNRWSLLISTIPFTPDDANKKKILRSVLLWYRVNTPQGCFQQLLMRNFLLLLGGGGLVGINSTQLFAMTFSRSLSGKKPGTRTRMLTSPASLFRFPQDTGRSLPWKVQQRVAPMSVLSVTHFLLLELDNSS